MKSKEQILREYKRIFEIRAIRDKLKWPDGRNYTFHEAEKYLKARENNEGRKYEN